MVLVSVFDIILRSVPELQDKSDDKEGPFYYIEMVTVAWFTFELLIRFLLCPQKIRFIFSLYTLFDLMSVVPYFVYLAIYTNATMKLIKNISRVFRVLFLFKLFRYSDSLRF